MSIISSDPPASHSLALTANTVGSWTCPVRCEMLVIVNETAGATWITVNGPAPTSAGDNEFFLAAPGDEGSRITIQMPQIPQGEYYTDPNYTGPVVQAITGTAGSIYIQAQ